jgi:hypothetical protein
MTDIISDSMSNKDGAKSSMINKVTPESLFNNLKNIIGRPYGFLDSADPKMRTFVKHMVPAAPLVMLRPGRIKFSDDPTSFIQKSLAKFGYATNTTNDAGRTTPDGTFSDEYGVSAADKKSIEDAIGSKQYGTVHNFDIENNSGSIRYFEFSSTAAIQREYMAVLSTLSSRLYSRMSGTAMTWANVNGDWDPPDTSNGGFYTFWADNASSVSESASANVGASKLAGLVKGVSEMSRELQFFLQKDIAQKDSAIATAVNSVSSYLNGGDATRQTSAGLSASLGDAILGMNPMFPEVWKDSSFSRSYNISFKFHSPYGDPASVYQNVLLPFTMLLSLVMPIQANPGTYTEPFVFQLDCPGYFACDLGICTDFSFVKGGSENLWTVDNLPRQIDVTMSVKDLYPVLTASKNTKSLYYNIGMSTFLDNLAGISLFRSENSKDLIQRTRAAVTSTLGQARAIPGQAATATQIFLEQNTPIPTLFRTFTSDR